MINWLATLISFLSITFLVVVRIHVNERFKKQLKNIPIPIELIVVSFLIIYIKKLNK